VEILKRFQMEDCKPMATPMITNLKKVTTSRFRVGGSYVVQAVDRFLDVFGQH
jgi:hypothetical protein